MPTMTPRAVGPRAGATVVLTALAAAGASWVAAPSAVAQGENGDIRIHDERHLHGTPLVGSAKDDPVVCRFYLEAVNFDTLTSIAYTITPQPPLPTAATVAGTFQLAGGAGHTDPLGLADGQYKISWLVGTPAALKEKVFRVNCKDGRHEGEHGPGGQISDGRHDDSDGRHDSDASWGKGDQNGPRGGVHAGGGGLIDTAAAYSPVAAAGAVGLIAVCGAVYIRLVRRRPHGAA
ncbi:MULTISPECIES: hypothetical protein [Streptomyces]|uniref:Secreted protein n=2 Tax=Streptomyces TaxID=1883 RepID=A0A117QAM4_STRCK|nr:hypothetical protein [Streptomyces corchorusii]AEY88431.1 hypothetical protein SHJG_3157 [Streptomyces hygroscopicus subsp. jinggangensis 5008]AGF62587.1 hypothetical protein SHJGH_2921 [Streptomyces hygroscopicus subsp. jinggangensis TL01]ALO92863.1 hypothetical protein SHL15_1699 [Streptomyces hygroscopicus subsp. limoneus]KUN17862.1 hypothetical protein AQJ11_36835 [Streptomyces corchorusii]